LLDNCEDLPQLINVIRSIDTYLLEIIAEDALPDTEDSNLQLLIDSLFASHQALIIDKEQNTNYQQEVRNLFFERRNHVILHVPEGKTRKRYAATGLSVESSISLDELIPELKTFLEDLPELTQNVFGTVINYACRATELAQQNPDFISLLGYEWIQTGRYDRIYDLAADAFRNFDEAVKFTEDVLCFQAPWVLSGFFRLVEKQIEIRPEWFELLPYFLRYGVNKKTQVWVMSLGFIDPKFSEWLLTLYEEYHHREPPHFRNFVQWLINNQIKLQKQVKSEWPSFFEEQFEKITNRYQRITKLINNQ